MKPCGCPNWATWVVRCEHKGRRVVALASPASRMAWGKERWDIRPIPKLTRWAVVGPAVWDVAVASEVGSSGLKGDATMIIFHGTKKDAEAEFRRRVEML